MENLNSIEVTVLRMKRINTSMLIHSNT